ncbi:MAG: hypothetical protein GTO63_17950 [Anaerolineae bacterium]|nr:hypothetical protein [Anaerolineae bacterium]NIN96687.1 hypothetical protein [Anaerolineae bacterium]NIQ82386.1 hypothetical protein [Anaerolineae bacterium]
MDVLFRDELERLAAQEDGVFAAIYMPTERAGAETRANSIRFKNLLRNAADLLREHGVGAPDVEDLLEPALKLQADSTFWQHQADGLAAFITRGFFRHYRLPLAFDELVVVTRRFHLKPLLPLLSSDGRFFVLALSQNEVRLLQCTRYRETEVEVEGMPHSLAEALRYDDPESQLQFHTGTPRGAGRRPAIHHGHGVGADDAKDNILRYFREIDSALRQVLREERAPLVLAGVQYLHPIYRDATTYPHLTEKGITGNPDELSAAELRERAWEIVQPVLRSSRREASERYRQLEGTGLTSNDVKEVVLASHDGRVQTLFVALGSQQWGAFDQQAREVDLHDEAASGDEDLMDLAAVRTLLNGGAVYAVEPQGMPADVLLAAVFRY